MFQYRWQIAKKMNLRRLTNLIGLRFSFYWMKWTGRSHARFFPFSATIEPTTACNLGCPECPSGLKKFTRETGKIDIDKHRDWLKELSPTVFYVNYYFQGEPFLHPQFLELIQEATKQKVFSSTSTNGHFITEKKANEIIDSGLGQLIISIDGMTQKTYEAYRINGKLDKVLAATELILNIKKARKSKTPHVVWQFLVVQPNEHEIEMLFTKAKEFEVDEVRLKTAQVYDFENGNPLIPKNEKYSRYRRNVSGKYVIKNKLLNECWRMWSSTVLTWDGKVVPCCFDKDAEHVLGSLENENFQRTWRNKRYSNFRKAVFNDREAIDICRNCTEGTKVFTQ
ncbi:MAG: SPASM domain-containing protein [Bacteroidetes bacterium]|nr:SPASM domain-containing protein [Bacteroidota bacterium]